MMRIDSCKRGNSTDSAIAKKQSVWLRPLQLLSTTVRNTVVS